jgi:hypothetical protein
MCRQPGRGVVCVDVEPVFGQSRNGRPHQLAAERKNQPVVAERFYASVLIHGDGAALAIDAGNLTDHQIDVDRTEYILERHTDIAEIGLVVAHSDRVPQVAVDDADRDVVLPNVQFGQLAGSADCRDQAGKPGSKHKDPLHDHLR